MTTNDSRLTASPIYPSTHTFPYLHVVKDDEESTGYTAYGLQLLTSVSAFDCDFCKQRDANALVESGATGSPVEGIYVHTHCVLETGVIARTEDVRLVEEEW